MANESSYFSMVEIEPSKISKAAILPQLLLSDGNGSLPASSELEIERTVWLQCEYGVCPGLKFKDRPRPWVASCVLKVWNDYTGSFQQEFQDMSKNPDRFFDWWQAGGFMKIKTGEKSGSGKNNPFTQREGVKCTIDWA